MSKQLTKDLREILGMLTEAEAPMWRPGTPFQQGMRLPAGYQMVFGTPREVGIGTAAAPKPAPAAATSRETPAAAEKPKKAPPKFVTPPAGTKDYATPDKLPDEPSRYFDITPDAIMVPVEKLQTIRARPEGIANAEILMANAYNGFNTRRKPISLKANADGSYTVMDGNSTTAIAAKHGWKNIVGQVVEGVEEDTLQGMVDDLRRMMWTERRDNEWRPGTPYEKGMALPVGWRLAYGKYPYQPKVRSPALGGAAAQSIAQLPGMERAFPDETPIPPEQQDYAEPEYRPGKDLPDAIEGLRRDIAAGEIPGTLDEQVKSAKEFLDVHRRNKKAFEDKLASVAPRDAEISVRVKDLSSAIGKISRKAADARKKGKKSKYTSVDLLGDGSGGRVICNSVDEVMATVKRVKDSFQVIEEEDSIVSPKGGAAGMGYRSIHLDVIDADGLRKELQIRTGNQHKHAEWAHHAYKPETAELQRVYDANSELINQYGRDMSDYFNALDTGRPPPRPAPDCPPIIQRTFGCL